MSRRIAHLDVLGEVRRAMRILRRVERYIVQQERAEKRAAEKKVQRENAARAARGEPQRVPPLGAADQP